MAAQTSATPPETPTTTPRLALLAFTVETTLDKRALRVTVEYRGPNDAEGVKKIAIFFITGRRFFKKKKLSQQFIHTFGFGSEELSSETSSAETPGGFHSIVAFDNGDTAGETLDTAAREFGVDCLENGEIPDNILCECNAGSNRSVAFFILLMNRLFGSDLTGKWEDFVAQLADGQCRRAGLGGISFHNEHNTPMTNDALFKWVCDRIGFTPAVVDENEAGGRPQGRAEKRTRRG